MQTFTANEAKTRFGEFLDRAQREPVCVMRHDIVVGAQDNQEMRAFYADRLRPTLDQAADKAAAKGLSEAALDQLLTDER